MQPKVGPAFVLIQRLDSSGAPAGSILNLGYNRNVKTTFKSKVVDINADNSPFAVAKIPAGLEAKETTLDLVGMNLVLYGIALGEAEGAIVGDVLTITGYSLPSNFRVLVIYVDIVANVGESIYSLIDEADSLVVDVYEYRGAAIGNVEVTREAKTDDASLLPIKIEPVSLDGVTLSTIKHKMGHTLSDASVLNRAAPITWPIALFTYA